MTKRMLFLSTAIAVVIALSAGTAEAKPFSLNLSTGLDAFGNVQSVGGSIDAFWSVTGTLDPLNPAFPNLAYVVAAGEPDWTGGVANNSQSAWIAGNPFSQHGNGTMTFTRTFILQPWQVPDAEVTGSWTEDDGGPISLNGHQLLGHSYISDWPENKQLWPVWSAPGDFVAGVNTLTMQIAFSDFAEEGGRFQGTLTIVPESSTWVMMGLGFAGLGFAAFHHKRNETARMVG